MHLRAHKRFLGPVMAIALLLSTAGVAGDTSHATAQSRMTVYRSLKIQKSRDLDFGTGFPGTPDSIVDPMTASGAEFTVTGEPNKAYSIVLPEKITLATEKGERKSQRIEIKQFRSSPQTTGNLGASGIQVLRVGATRTPLAEDQEPGEYSGAFTVTVTYQ